MTDQTLLSALHSLGIDEDSVAAIAMLPLVEVAWADTGVGEEKRAVILDIARKRGVLEGESALLLESWLRYRPSRRYLTRGRQVLAELARRGHGGAAISPRTLAEVLTLCEDVALAASGLLGRAFRSQAIQTAGPETRQALAEIALTLSLGERPRWDDVAVDLAASTGALRRAALEDDDTAVEITDPNASLIPDRPVRGGSPVVRIVRKHTERAEDKRPAMLLRMREGASTEAISIPERGLSIGRRTDNDVALVDDAQVSRQHCRVFRSAGRVYVVDCASAGGTWVNGERVHERRLLGGEDIAVGQARFLFTLGRIRD